MALISYAQNFEDVILWRCFGHLKKGFYIDVGAYDDELDSVTRVFYDAGWHGIDIEPSQRAFESIKDKRVRDINLNIGCGAKNEHVSFWEIEGTGLSTSVEGFKNQHIQEGKRSKEYSIEVQTLESICNKYAPTSIQFLKIEVEGFEKEVLLGCDFTKYRPEVLLVEATDPNSQNENYSNWEYILLDNYYTHCYSDGLNRYYLANECKDLLPFFKYPPNVFDNFMLASNERMRQEIDWLNYSLSEASNVVLKLQNDLNLVYSSKSWFITKPLGGMLRLLRSRRFKF
jgi:FkbM family methyltransferase